MPVEPVPVDSSLMRSPLQSDQEQVVADCYRQPFMAVIGGPGTSKSVLAARLAHLLMARNRTTDSFRQAHLTGPSNQLMICAPTERSLDVITGDWFLFILLHIITGDQFLDMSLVLMMDD